MQKRSPIAVFLLPFITFGIYGWFWLVKTKGEMNKLGENVPTAWIWLIPFGTFYWMWKYSEAVEHVTHQKLSGVLAFILLLFLGGIGAAVVQDSFNKLESGVNAAVYAAQAPAPIATAAAPAFTPAATPQMPTSTVSPTAISAQNIPTAVPPQPVSTPPENSTPTVS